MKMKKEIKYEIVDLTNGDIYDNQMSKKEAQRETRHLNKVHNPPSYQWRAMAVPLTPKESR